MFFTPYFSDCFRNFEKYNATNLTQLPNHQEHEPQFRYCIKSMTMTELMTLLRQLSRAKRSRLVFAWIKVPNVPLIAIPQTLY